MNNPNPFVPQGSLLEQEKRRSRMKLAVFCSLAFGVAVLTAMLIQGCKRESADNTPPVDTNTVVATETNTLPMGASNTTAIVPPIPTNEVVVPPPAETATSEYTVVAGDTLGKIAKKSGVTLKALEAANPGVVPTKLKLKQKLVIPAATGVAAPAATTGTAEATGTGGQIYTVKSNDTLTKIAKQYGVSIKAIQSENNLTTTRITVGKKLKIPAKAEAAVAAPAPAVSPAPVAPMLTTKPVH